MKPDLALLLGLWGLEVDPRLEAELWLKWLCSFFLLPRRGEAWDTPSEMGPGERLSRPPGTR